MSRRLKTLPGMISRLFSIASATNSLPSPSGRFGEDVERAAGHARVRKSSARPATIEVALAAIGGDVRRHVARPAPRRRPTAPAAGRRRR